MSMKIKSIFFIGLFFSFNLLFTGCRKENKNIIRVGIDLKYPPFMYINNEGKPSGLEVDLAYAFGKYLGKKVEIINTDFTMLVASLESGETDILISDMSISEQRKRKMSFSKGYRYGKTMALVNKKFYREKNISEKMSSEEFFKLEGMKCIGLSGTIGVEIPNRYGKKVTEATEIGMAIGEITKGRSNVMLGNYTVIGNYLANKETTDIYLGIKDYSISCFVVRKGNKELLDKANKFIEGLYEKGGLYEQLEIKYDKIITDYFKNKKMGFKYIVEKPE